jgi:exosortase/archaeosortase family protein
MAYLLAAATRQGWWERVLMFLGAAPVALLANSARIVATALLYERLSEETARRVAHDATGWITVPLAAVLLALLLWTSGQIYRRTEVADVGDLLLDRRLGEHAA